MKKFISALLVFCICICFLSGCSSDDESRTSGKYKIVTTSFAAYDWAKNIIGEKNSDFSISLLCDNGTDMHSYQPTAADIVSICECDLFIYVGSSSEEWAEDVLKTADKDIQVINMLETVGSAVLEEEFIEGMTEDEHNHDHSNHETESDEHIWLSLKNAVSVCREIEKAIGIIDEKSGLECNTYREKYEEELLGLYNKYSEEFKEKKDKPLIFADRFPFKYLTEEFGLEYFACFNGCSTETEASFDSVIFLADKIDEFGVESVLVIEGSNQKVAKTVISNTRKKNQQTLTLDSMQSVTADRIDKGLTYISAMEENLKLINNALS